MHLFNTKVAARLFPQVFRIFTSQADRMMDRSDDLILPAWANTIPGAWPLTSPDGPVVDDLGWWRHL